MDRNLIKKISEKIFSLFVVNTAAAGIQQKDGKYITKYIPVTPALIESMILANGSMGCYQQGYKTGYIKWICLDFDCKDKKTPDLYKLYDEVVLPVTQVLSDAGIRYLTEFSGRRGIHIWIVFDHIIRKTLGYRILTEIIKCSNLDLSEEESAWGLDKFPSTDSSKGNTVGKQVKFPLSTHRAGGMAYFFTGAFDLRTDLGTDGFFADQFRILSQYQENNVEDVMTAFSLSDDYRKEYSHKFRKYKVLDALDVTLNEIWAVLSETNVFRSIYARMRKGQAHPQDWTVILGTLSPCDQEARLVRAVLKEFPNYDEEKTTVNIKRYKDRYFPATFGYLYDLYDMEIEDGLNPEMTGFAYLCERLGVTTSEVQTGEHKTLYKNQLDIKDTINKEKDYLLNNDESPDIYIWNQLHLMRHIDREELRAIVDDAERTGAFARALDSYRLFERIESPDKTRRLISLSARDRVVTTHLALDFCRECHQRWRSFSYRPALTSRWDIFYDWYRCWGKYIERINVFIEVPFFNEYGILFVDLKQFYDHIDFLSVYRALQEELSEKATNILKYLISYNDALMTEVNCGSRIGVPQGPAYARIIAEIYLNKIITGFEAKYKDQITILRYVDDITIVCVPGVDSRAIFDDFCDLLSGHGLPVNSEKSRCYGLIKELTEEQRRTLLHSDNFNYDLRDNYRNEVTLLQERRENLNHYLEDRAFDMRSLGYIFGSQTLQEAKDWCFNAYRVQIISSEIGRGSNFRRFYEYIFRTDKYLSIVLAERLFASIPMGTVNFSNFIDSLYLSVQRHEIDPNNFERIKREYLCQLNENELEPNDRAVLAALRIIRLEEREDEL